MADNYILPDPSPVCAGFPNINVYEIEVNLTEPDQESKYIIVPADVQQIVVTVEPFEDCKSNIFTTTDLFKKVITDDPGITWKEWDIGESFNTEQDTCSKVTALKVVQIGIGSVKFTARMQ